MEQPAHASAAALCQSLRKREISSRELLEHFLERVARLDPALNAVVTLDAPAARRQADAADAELARGAPRGPLHGLPVTVKDSFETAGLRSTCGAQELAAHVPARDAEAVARLRAAGAIVFGKTNTPAWASDWQTTNPLFGTTRNPWDRDRTPGGSSGGAAAALAAGLTGLELGSDIGGSIRVPAHWSGVCGHKPSHGLVPQRGHLPGRPGARAEVDLNVVGPLARAPEDLALALDVLAGPLPERGVAWRLALPPARGMRLEDFRVGTWLDDRACPCDGEMRDVIEAALDALRRAGARVSDARPPIDLGEAARTYLELLMPLNTRFQDAEGFGALRAVADALPRDAGDWLSFALRAQAGRTRDWLEADERRHAARARFADFFREHDVLLCPVNPTAAIPHDERPFPQRTIRVDGRERPYMELAIWPGLVSASWLPATVIPLGLTRGGLPVGVQIVGPFLEDRTSLAFAQAAAATLGGFRPPPEPPPAA